MFKSLENGGNANWAVAIKDEKKGKKKSNGFDKILDNHMLKRGAGIGKKKDARFSFICFITFIAIPWIIWLFQKRLSTAERIHICNLENVSFESFSNSNRIAKWGTLDELLVSPYYLFLILMETRHLNNV